jgi:antitoxin component YwqK of YwqJK toxin-antitoxin module
MKLFNLFGKKKKLKNGTWREYNKHAVIVTEGTFMNDLKHGAWRYYYDTGTLAIEEHYEYDRLHGVYRSFYPDGTLMSEGRYEHSSREGYFQVYNEQGELMRVILYARNVLVADTPQPEATSRQPVLNVLTPSQA